jgi:hypothetical protein
VQALCKQAARYLDTALVVLNAPLGSGAEVAKLHAKGERALLVAGLGGMLDDCCQCSDVGPHRKLWVLLEAAYDSVPAQKWHRSARRTIVGKRRCRKCSQRLAHSGSSQLGRGGLRTVFLIWPPAPGREQEGQQPSAHRGGVVLQQLRDVVHHAQVPGSAPWFGPPRWWSEQVVIARKGPLRQCTGPGCQLKTAYRIILPCLHLTGLMPMAFSGDEA